MTNLLDDDKLRDGFTYLYLAWKGYERAALAREAELRRLIDDLRNRVEILEVRQAGEDQRIP